MAATSCWWMGECESAATTTLPRKERSTRCCATPGCWPAAEIRAALAPTLRLLLFRPARQAAPGGALASSRLASRRLFLGGLSRGPLVAGGSARRLRGLLLNRLRLHQLFRRGELLLQLLAPRLDRFAQPLRIQIYSR